MIEEKKFFGARMETRTMKIIDKIAEENKVDRTSAIKILINAGWRELQLERALQFYREGKISLDKAAKIAGITVNEMMQEAAAHGIKSEETIEEYKEGVKILISK